MANICNNVIFLKTNNKEEFEAVVNRYDKMDPHNGLALEFLKEVTGAKDGEIATFGDQANIISDRLNVDRVINSSYVPLNSNEHGLAIVFESKWSPVVISESVMDRNLITGYMNYYEEPGCELKGIKGYEADTGVIDVSFSPERRPDWMSLSEFKSHENNWCDVHNESECDD